MLAGLARDVVAGGVAGYLGSRTMDRVTTWYWDRMSEQSKQREHDANPLGTGLVVGRAAARLLGRGEAEDVAYRTAQQVHRGLGVSYGVVAALAARRTHPMAAGLLTGAGAFLLVDEAALSLVLPPPTRYPVESHVRGAVGHLALGAAVGLLLSALPRR